MNELFAWLVTPQGIPVLVALVGVVSGIAGALASQLTAGFFKERGDRRQLNAAKEQFESLQSRWKQEQEFEREKLLLEKRREVFTNYLQALERATEVLKVIHQHGRKTNNYLELLQEASARVDAVYVIGTEIRLIAPAAKDAAYQAYKVAKEVRSADPHPDRSGELLAKLKLHRRAVRAKMTEILGIPEPEFDNEALPVKP